MVYTTIIFQSHSTCLGQYTYAWIINNSNIIFPGMVIMWFNAICITIIISSIYQTHDINFKQVQTAHLVSAILTEPKFWALSNIITISITNTSTTSRRSRRYPGSAEKLAGGGSRRRSNMTGNTTINQSRRMTPKSTSTRGEETHRNIRSAIGAVCRRRRRISARPNSAEAGSEEIGGSNSS